MELILGGKFKNRSSIYRFYVDPVEFFVTYIVSYKENFMIELTEPGKKNSKFRKGWLSRFGQKMCIIKKYASNKSEQVRIKAKVL